MTSTLVAQGLPCRDWQVRLHPSGDRAVFDLSALAFETAHPYRLQCEQWKLTRAVHARLAGRVEVMPGATVEAFAQDDDGVTAEIECRGERLSRRARFLVGCDGARSTVRKTLGLPFEGETYPETTILATTEFAFEAELLGLSSWSSRCGPRRWMRPCNPSCPGPCPTTYANPGPTVCTCAWCRATRRGAWRSRATRPT